MKMDRLFDHAMSDGKIREYLEQAGFSPSPEELSRICSWDELQTFLSRKSVVGTRNPPIANTRLKTYGLGKTHPLKMLARHVVS